MFTGIISALGSIQKLESVSGDWRLTVSSSVFDFSDVNIGDSISVSGVCLTATSITNSYFVADVSNETMACTVLASLTKGSLVNLEKAMQANDRFGGHIVSGHVDGLAELLSKEDDGRSVRLRYKVSMELAKYIAQKGSVCLDGVSLTVNEVSDIEFTVNIIPHTVAETTIKLYKPGRMVNIEVDVVSRYLERLMQAGSWDQKPELNMEFLAKSGFVQ